MARTNDRRAGGGTGAGQHRHADQPGDSGRLLRTLAIVAVAVGLTALTAAACLLSYDSVHALALQAGVKTSLATVYPVIGDATLVVAGCSVLALRGAGLVSRVYAWLCFVVLLAALAATGVAQAAAMTVPAKTAEVTAAVLPWALVLLVFGLLLAMLRHVRRRRPSHRASGPAQTPPQPAEPAEPAVPPPAPVAPSDPTVPSLAIPQPEVPGTGDGAEPRPVVVETGPGPVTAVAAAGESAAGLSAAGEPVGGESAVDGRGTAEHRADERAESGSAVPTAAALASAALGKHAAPEPLRTGWPGPQPSVPAADHTGWPDIGPSGSTFGDTVAPDATSPNVIPSEAAPPNAAPPNAAQPGATPRGATPPGATPPGATRPEAGPPDTAQPFAGRRDATPAAPTQVPPPAAPAYVRPQVQLPDAALEPLPEPPPRIIARPVEMQLRARRQQPRQPSAAADSPAPTTPLPVIPPPPVIPPAPATPPAPERGSASEPTVVPGRAHGQEPTAIPDWATQIPARPPVMPPSGVAPPSGMSASRYGGDTVPKGQVSSTAADQPRAADDDTNPPAEAPVLDRPRSSPTPPTG